MNSFKKCSVLGDKGEKLVLMLLREYYNDVRPAKKGDIDLQSTWGDLVVVGRLQFGFKRYTKIEVKTEFSHTGKLFWEEYSNRTLDRPGWGLTCQADELFYLFWKEAIGYRIPDLQECIRQFEKTRNEFKPMQQTKHAQNNDTWARLVPVNTSWLSNMTAFSFKNEKTKLENDND